MGKSDFVDWEHVVMEVHYCDNYPCSRPNRHTIKCFVCGALEYAASCRYRRFADRTWIVQYLHAREALKR